MSVPQTLIIITSIRTLTFFECLRCARHCWDTLQIESLMIIQHDWHCCYSHLTPEDVCRFSIFREWVPWPCVFSLNTPNLFQLATTMLFPLFWRICPIPAFAWLVLVPFRSIKNIFKFWQIINSTRNKGGHCFKVFIILCFSLLVKKWPLVTVSCHDNAKYLSHFYKLTIYFTDSEHCKKWFFVRLIWVVMDI